MIRPIAVALAAMLLVACASQPPVPEDHFYRLPAPVAADPLPLSEGTIFVEQFIADGVYRERPLAYVTGEPAVEILQYHYHHWMDTPARLLRDQLIDYLRARAVAPLVTDAGDVPSDLNIFGKIRRFDQKEAGGEVVVVLDFRVDKAGVAVPVLLKGYERRVSAAGKGVPAAVAAYNIALSGIFSDLVADLAAAR